MINKPASTNAGRKRDWKLMHRYTFHHVFLPTGWKAVVGVVCQPHTCTRCHTCTHIWAEPCKLDYF